MSFPAFMGWIGSEDRHNGAHPEDNHGWEPLFACESPKMKVCIRGTLSQNSCYLSFTTTARHQPTVLIRGNPLVASDTEFSANTGVDRVKAIHLPDKILQLYRERGTKAFGLLEGNFCLVLADPESQSVFLVSDKFGCEDIFVRRYRNSLEFATDASILTDSSSKFDPITAGFFLAQEGFVPAPFTLFESVKTVGKCTFLRIKQMDGDVRIESGQCWSPPLVAPKLSREAALQQFAFLLGEATDARRRTHNGILLSGGFDSSLLTNLLARSPHGNSVAITGAVRGHDATEFEVRKARRLASALGIRHESIFIDPADQRLPEEWSMCCGSWTGGTRSTVPLFLRLAKRMNSMFGSDYSAFSGQMADTLADNNYTVPSAGYALRRIFFSRAFLGPMPFIRAIAHCANRTTARLLLRAVELSAGQRIASMMASFMDGVCEKEWFYAGRVFGFGEMPGRAAAAFPALSTRGFDCIADWYISQFVAPIIRELTPDTFYQGMIQMSLAMCMLHLDTRLVFHAFRLGGGNAELPFLDSRLVNFFAQLPDSARPLYRKPKYIIREQFKRHRLTAPQSEPRAKRAGVKPFRRNSRPDISFEQLLFGGSLGVYIRELLHRPSALDCAPGIFEFIDEQYFERQRNAFLRGDSDTDYKFISRLAALELWTRSSVRDRAPAAHPHLSVSV